METHARARIRSFRILLFSLVGGNSVDLIETTLNVIAK
jgi:hypothetical protein